MENQNTDTGKTNQANDENTKHKVEFTTEQQERINELIKDAMGRAGKEHKTAAEEAAAKLREFEQRHQSILEELNSLKSGKKGEDNPDLKAEIERVKNLHNEELAKLRKQAQDSAKLAEEATNNFKSLKKTNALHAAAGKVNFYDVDAVITLTQNHIQWDEERSRFVVMENGTPKMNAAFEPMSLEEFYSDYASKNPYLVRGDVKGGAGSTEATRSNLSKDGKYELKDVFGPDSNSKLANDLAKRDKAEYLRLKALAKSAGLIQ